MTKEYNYRNCLSLFGYAEGVHKRSGGICQLCGAGKGKPIDFDLWRQLTVEHLIGNSQGGYLNQIRDAIYKRFPNLSDTQKEELAQRINRANTVTACHFCNSLTSRNKNFDMTDLILNAKGEPDEVVDEVILRIKDVLKHKQIDVNKKIDSVRDAFNRLIKPELAKHSGRSYPPSISIIG